MSNDVCVVSSAEFLKHSCLDTHPENPGRVAPLIKLLEEPGFKSFARLDPTSAEEKAILRVHSAEMVKKVLSARGREGWFDPDTFYVKDSIEISQLAAGSVIDAALSIWKGEYRRGFTLVRPPGHHAVPDRPMGFCIFNNVALAAAAILDASPNARIAIVDFDLHHGNGTQDIFYDNPNVLFVSSHRYPYYPGTGAVKEVGIGKGKGTTINFPLPKAYGDSLFLGLYGELVSTMIKSFAPDMILVSAGFDGHELDPMQGFRITTPTYRTLAEMLVSLAERKNGKILFCLEGGYNPEALKDSVAEVLEVLRDFPRKAEEVSGNEKSGDSDVASVITAFRNYHASFFPEL